MNKQYTDAFHRLCATATERRLQQGQPMRLPDVVDQISLRALVLGSSSSKLELAATRAVLRAACVEDGQVVWPREVTVGAELEDTTPAQLADAQASAERPLTEIRAAGTEILSQAAQYFPHLPYEEVLEVLSGATAYRKQKEKQKDRRAISERDLRQIEMELAGHEPWLALRALEAGKRPDMECLARVFTHVVFHTGIRTIELCSLRVFVPRREIPDQRKLRQDILDNPIKAILDGKLLLAEENARADGDHICRAAANAVFATGAPAVLVIGSAKLTNANEDLRAESRLQILDGIARGAFDMIIIASMLRYLNLPERRRVSVCKGVLTALRRVCDRSALFDGREIDLHAFRHAFATRAKRAYSPPAAAALTGHTSRPTLYMYGERRARRTDAGAATGWLPKPDPIAAAAIEAKWRATDPEPTHPKHDHR